MATLRSSLRPCALFLVVALSALGFLAPGVAVEVKAAVDSTTPCISSFDAGTDYFPGVVQTSPFALPVGLTTSVQNAYNFSVQYEKYYKVARDTKVNTTYVLYLCGTQVPAVAESLRTNGTFQIPLSNYGMRTTVPANFLQLLGVVDQLRWVADAQLVDPCLQKFAASLAPTANFVGPVIDAGEAPFSSPNISFSATQDPGILNRAEWIKYLALFFNKEERAAAVFKNISDDYNCLKSKANQAQTKRTAAWLSFYEGGWVLSNATFKLQVVADGGGQSPAALQGRQQSYNLSIPAQAAAFHAMLLTVDVVFDETYPDNGPALYNFSAFAANAQLSAAESQKFSSNVWNIYGQYSNGTFYATAWYESAVSQPQVVLEEAVAILQPSLFPNGLSHTYFYNLNNGVATLMTPDKCTAQIPSQAQDPRLTSCTPQTPPTSVASPGPPTSAAPTLSAVSWLLFALLGLALEGVF